MLVYADVAKFDRRQFAVCGASADPTDPSNDPKHAAELPHERDIRASLIRWLEVDRSASNLVDPKGVRILCARVTGALDLSQVRMPFPMALVRCLIPEPINLVNAEIPEIDLGCSYTAEITALNLNVRGVLFFGVADTPPSILMLKVPAALSGVSVIDSESAPSKSGLASASKRNFSQASEAFEISSRRKMSLSE